MNYTKAIETYQCPGCVCGGNVNCGKFSDNNGCEEHVPGTAILGLGHILLGMPTGFNKIRENKVRIYIFKSFADAAEAFNKFNFLNMPIWKYKDEHCNTLLRIFMPRISTSCIAVILEDCMDKIKCLEITEKELEHID
jgi:hypothetical protein